MHSVRCVHLALTVIVTNPLPVLIQFAHKHLPRPEIEGAEIHGVSQISGQLRFTPKLLPCWTKREKKDQKIFLTFQTDSCTSDPCFTNNPAVKKKDRYAITQITTEKPFCMLQVTNIFKQNYAKLK